MSRNISVSVYHHHKVVDINTIFIFVGVSKENNTRNTVGSRRQEDPD
jgi:hypothetical protein